MKTEPRLTTRLHAVDNLRVMLTALVVLHHVALTYGNIPLWYYVEPARDPSGIVLDILVVVNQAFFMGFFFLIAGFFTPGSYDRKGPRAFLRDRLVRLGVPLLAFLLLLRPLVTLDGYAREGWTHYLRSWDPGPMWFVEVLLIFAAGYALFRRFARPGETRREAPKGRSIVLFTAGLAVVTILWRLIVPTGSYVPVLGLPTPDFLPQYVAMFAAGTVAVRRGWFELLTRRAGRIGFAVAGASSAALVPLTALTRGAVSEIAAAVWQSVFAVGVIIGLVVLFRDRFSAQGPRLRFLSDHAFAVYVIHPVVVVGVAWALRGLEAAAVVKFAVAAALALPLCWAGAYLVRKLPGARRVL